MLFWPETCIFVAFLVHLPCCFGAVLRLEPLTFNPSVLGSNPRGPTNFHRRQNRLRDVAGELRAGYRMPRGETPVWGDGLAPSD